MLRILSTKPKNYDWGTPDALSRLMGHAPSGKPEAELWFGPHPLSDCTISAGPADLPFSQWLEQSGHTFPLLVKFLAASKPLSIQVHPDRGAAKEGFLAEQLAGVAEDSGERTFKDSEPKPELLIPLSPTFDVLWGVQDASTLNKKFDRWRDSGLASRTVEGLRDVFGRAPEEALQSVMGSHPEVQTWVSDLSEWAKAPLGSSPEATQRERDVFRRLVASFPGDTGIVVATLMHVKRLRRGEALFVRPGEIHAYVEGFALEVMLPSDNVARAGLTSKHVDPAVFLALADLTPHSRVPVLSGTEGATGGLFDVADLPFVVTEITGECTLDVATDAVVVVESAGLRYRDSDTDAALPPGFAAFVSPDDSPLHLSGQGTAWLVEPR